MAFKDKKEDPRRQIPGWVRKIAEKVGVIEKLHTKEKETHEEGVEEKEERPDTIVIPEKKGFKGKKGK